MPTPLLNFRLPTSERLQLVEMSKLYGAPNVSVFLREMVGAMCSGSAERVRDFNVRLFSKVGEQLALNLSAPAVQIAEAAKRAVESQAHPVGSSVVPVKVSPQVIKPRKKRKKRRARARVS
jgi:hypothetical protein